MSSRKVEKEVKKRMWKPEEDMLLKRYIEIHGEGNWAAVSKKLGLQRGGKSCRLRWKNYLRPDIKHGSMSKDEEDLIIRMHNLIGNRWSLIAGRLPGRTDNEVKNYWNTHLSKKENSSAQPKRKAKEVDVENHENILKKAKIDDGNDGSTQLNKHSSTTTDGVVIREENNTHISHDETKDEEINWMNNLSAVQILGDSNVENFVSNGNLRVGMDFEELLFYGNEGEYLAWDHATYVLFDAFANNWEHTLPPS